MFVFEVVVGEFYIFDDFFDWAVSLLVWKFSAVDLGVFFDFPFDKLILQGADILVKILNYGVDVFVEDPREFLVILIVLTDSSDFMSKLIVPVEPFQILIVLIKADKVFELVHDRTMVATVHFVHGGQI